MIRQAQCQRSAITLGAWRKRRGHILFSLQGVWALTKSLGFGPFEVPPALNHLVPPKSMTGDMLKSGQGLEIYPLYEAANYKRVQKHFTSFSPSSNTSTCVHVIPTAVRPNFQNM